MAIRMPATTLAIVCRAATSADFAAIAQSRLSDATDGPADPRMAAYLEGLHHPHQALPPRVGYVALSGDQVVGYIAGHETTRHGCQGEVQYLFVASAYRRRGIATAMLRLLADWFQQQRSHHVCVGVANDSPPGTKHFVENAGAKPFKKHWYAWEDIRIVLRP